MKLAPTLAWGIFNRARAMGANINVYINVNKSETLKCHMQNKYNVLMQLSSKMWETLLLNSYPVLAINAKNIFSPLAFFT